MERYMPKNLPVSAERLWADLMTLADFTDRTKPYTRRSFTDLFLKGRSWLADRFEEAGLRTSIDASGNLIGRLDGSDPHRGVIAIGSHSDTVPSGGRFDGTAGVISGLEVVRSARDAGISFAHTIEVIDFLAEEPSEYGLSCIGSRGMAAALDEKMLALTNSAGETLAAGLTRVGGQPERLLSLKRADLRAFLELHIEQGPLLEEGSFDVGIVTEIVGVRRLEIFFLGEADHAGTTPMELRKDALVAAAETVISVRRLATEFASKQRGYFVATVGILYVDPCASNVVPGSVRLVVDVRATRRELIEEFTAVLDVESLRIAGVAHVAREKFDILSDGTPIECDPRLRTDLRSAAHGLGLRDTDLPSGAGHDTAFMARICPSAMVFIPCRRGKSHAPEEWADRHAIAAGTAVLLHAIMAIDDRLVSTPDSQRAK
jgi:N-carbamoyl-L-amino-acid hydrolase